MQIEIWSDVVCPWCYLGKRRFEQALESFDHGDEVAVVYRSFELDPAAPRTGTTSTTELLADKYGMTVEEATNAQREMTQRAAGDGLAFQLTDLRSGNTRDAHRLLHLAKAQDRQAELAERLHRAYFIEQRSVFDPASLRQIAVEAGVDADTAARVLDGDEYDEAVQADELMAQSLGVTGVPFFVVDRRYGVSGAQPAGVITGILDHAWTESRAS